ncbi:MAG: two-component system, LytTR family, sensor histidine kinase LytS [Syntrophus sp. SKADARSKE-3]|nr:two-component system, LytTR family, sensor histidine kinase LytS [Syntrophus sp. SKADARSKE-3]
MTEIVSIMFTLLNSMAVIAVIAYVLTKVQLYQDIMENKITWRNRILLMLVFGLLSIYGTMSGFKLMDAIANTRDLGPALAGLLAGPVVGLGAGLIGGIHRYSLGGLTCVSCSLATVIAGLVGGLVWRWNKGKFIGIPGAAAVAVVNQVIHSGLALLIVQPFDQAYLIVRDFTLPMILANGVGMALYAFIITNLIRERALEKAKQLIVGELQAANQIQMSMIPKIFPPFPEHASFQLHAVLEPAREVGGDLYDYFFVDDRHLVFYAGDVSGKGVPASLFMAMTTTLLRAKSKAIKGIGPHDILTGVNRELCRGNETSMFVTLYCGIFDILTGETQYSNAGHNPPVLLHRGHSPEYLSSGENPPLGVMDDYEYTMGTLHLAPGDVLFLYTDGVTEAMNQQDQLFSEPRLLECLDRGGDMEVRDLVTKILADVHTFTKGAPPSDDMTILAIKYTPLTPVPAAD